MPPDNRPLATLTNALRALTQRVLRFVALTALTTSAALMITASPAAAHGGIADATNWRSDVLDPGASDLEWKVLGGDALVSLRNRTGEIVIVRGYEGEPYLQFVPGDGVWENQRSPATYLNRDRYAGFAVPESADPSAEPEWKQVASGDEHRWHDHRTHWMSPQRPPIVDADPAEPQLVLAWDIPVSAGPTLTKATGELWWVPGTNGALVVVAFVLAGATVLLAASRATRVHEQRWPGLAKVITAVVGAVWVGDLVRTIDDIVAVPASVAEQVTFIAVAALTLTTTGALIARGRRGDLGSFFALAGAGTLLMVSFAAEQSDQLSASQLATVLPLWVRRWSIAASWAVLIPSIGALLLAMRYIEPTIGRGTRQQPSPQA